MDTITMLCVASGLAIFIIVCLLAIIRSREVRLLKKKNTICEGKNQLYQEYIHRTPLNKFMAILETVRVESIDLEIAFIIEKYFESVLYSLAKSMVPSLLADLDKSRHSIILRKNLARAAIKYEGIFGLALAVNFSNSEEESAIQSFLCGLPAPQRKIEYSAALNAIENDYKIRKRQVNLSPEQAKYLSMSENIIERLKGIIAEL